MPNIIMTRTSHQLDGSLKKKAYSFLEKLSIDDTTLGLHIEPIKNAVDPRVRTGRVDDGVRAVLFKIVGSDEPTYVFHGIWQHDEAISVAMRTTLAVNPVTGITEIRTVEPSLPSEPSATPSDAGEAAPVPSEQDAPRSLLKMHGITESRLVEDLGIAQETAAAAMAVTDDDGMLEVAGQAVEWQGLALLDLAAGTGLDEVKARLSLDSPVEVGTDGVSDDAILRGLEHDAARLTFTYIEDDEALRRAIDEGDFGAWRVFLHPEQRRYVKGSWNGPFRLTGGAGTGKTVVVLHRARELARRTASKVIVTTYTTNLAESMRRDLKRLDGRLPLADQLGEDGVLVSGVDALAVQTLKRAGELADAAAVTVLGDGARAWTVKPSSDRWRIVLEIHGDKLPETLRSESFLQAEYTSVILPARITDEASYLKVRRPGAGVALDRAKRKAVWQVVSAYRSRGAVAEPVDFDEAAAVAAVYLEQQHADGVAPLGDHVLVDEAQDLTPARLQFLRALAGSTTRRDDLFLAEDSHQRIYGRKVVLSRYGIAIVGRSRRLTLNYRTTAQNLAFALGILAPGSYTDMLDEPETMAGYRSARSGPQPAVHACASLAEEYDNAARVITGWLGANVAPETIAVLVRDRYQRDRVAAALAERGVESRAVDREAIKPGLPVVLTMHRAKGTEFSRVLLFGVSEGSIPAALRSEKYSEDAWSDALLRERSLLYVAATRARDELAISWSGRQSDILGEAPSSSDAPQGRGV